MQIYWFAIRVTYGREIKLKKYLENKGVTCYIPMQYVHDIIKGKIRKKIKPAINNLIFINCSIQEMNLLKQEIEPIIPIRYIMDKSSRKPVVIPDKQMLNFISVSRMIDSEIIYLDPEIASLKKGDPVRIAGGIFKDIEGEFMRIRGDRRVVVRIKGLIAVATTFIHPSLLIKLKQTKP